MYLFLTWRQDPIFQEQEVMDTPPGPIGQFLSISHAVKREFVKFDFKVREKDNCDTEPSSPLE